VKPACTQDIHPEKSRAHTLRQIEGSLDLMHGKMSLELL
jgi:hypothetical protein